MTVDPPYEAPFQTYFVRLTGRNRW